MFTITADTILPCTVTGSWPRPHWFDQSMWGRPLDTCMMDVRFREKFQDALATVLSDQERAGLDILPHGDLHCDDDMAGWTRWSIARSITPRSGAWRKARRPGPSASARVAHRSWDCSSIYTLRNTR